MTAAATCLCDDSGRNSIIFSSTLSSKYGDLCHQKTIWCHTSNIGSQNGTNRPMVGIKFALSIISYTVIDYQSIRVWLIDIGEMNCDDILYFVLLISQISPF